MSVRLAGILSLMLNVVLVAAWLNLRSNRPPLPPADAFAIPKRSVKAPKSPPPTPSPTASTVAADTAPPWLRIESAEFPTFIRNLQDVGCPERSIRDIVAHEIAKIYDERRSAVPKADRFWWTEAERSAEDRARALAEARLELEERSVLKALLGVESNWPEVVSRPAEWAIFCWGTAVSSMEAVELACRVIDSAKFQLRFLEAEVGEPFTLNEVARLKELRDDALRQIQAAIGPQRSLELVQLAALNPLFEHSGASEIAPFHLSSDELRRIAALLPPDLKAFNELVEMQLVTKYERFMAGLPKEPTADERMAMLAPPVAKALGPRRAKQLSRLFDEHWSDAIRFANSQELPLHVAEALSDMKHTALEESKRLRDAPELEPADEEQGLEAVGLATLAALERLLPDKALNDYLLRHGAWLTNVAKGRNP